jgi:hypothetical protein
MSTFSIMLLESLFHGRHTWQHGGLRAPRIARRAMLVKAIMKEHLSYLRRKNNGKIREMISWSGKINANPNFGASHTTM